MSIASNISRGSASARQPRPNGFVLVEPVYRDEAYVAADETNDKTTDCPLSKAVQDIYRAAVGLSHTLQSRDVTAAHLIMAILANEAARFELRTMGVKNEAAWAGCYAQIGAQTAARSGANGLQPSAEDFMGNLLRRAMEKARKRHDPELHVVGVSDLCAALMDLSRTELRIRMLLQGLSATEAAVQEAQHTVLRRIEQRSDARKMGSMLVRTAAGIALLAAAALASWYAIGSSGGWAPALSWLGGMPA